MKFKKSYINNVDPQNKLTIPPEFVQKLNLTPEDELEFLTDGVNIIVRKYNPVLPEGYTKIADQ